VSHEGILPAYQAVVDALQESGLSYAFIGALAAIEWGRPRATANVDLVVSIDPAHWPSVQAAFQSRGLAPGRGVGPAESSDPLPDIAIFWSDQAPSVRIDLFIAKTDFERTVLEGARVASIGGREVRIASPEAVIIYKLLASRPKDLVDLDSIFESRQLAQAPLDWAFLERWAEAWEISDRLGPYRVRFGPSTG
jgi:hypothetical protein